MPESRGQRIPPGTTSKERSPHSSPARFDLTKSEGRAAERAPGRPTLSPDEAAIAAVNLAFYVALESRDLAGMERVWLQEDSASCIHPGWHRIDGWPEVRRSWQNIFANSRAWTVSCEQTRISREGDLAWVTCVEAISPFGAESSEATARMQATNVFRRKNGEWRMIHHHASPSQAEATRGEEPVN